MREGTVKQTSGFARTLGFNLFYRVFEPEGKPKGTIVCLHGGPGACHEYLLPLADLALSGYNVLFYDQLGCGRSDVPKNYALFSVERGVEE
jgi:proline iminopeptidase